MSKAYIGTKRVTATPMNRLAYNEHRGWKLPEDENGADDGFLVQYENGYITWSPREVFEESYRTTDHLSFGLAIEALKQGKRVTRPSWNGKGMWLVLVKADIYDVGIHTVTVRPGSDPVPEFAPWIGMLTAQGKFTPWAPAQSDVLADDWMLLSEEPVTSTFRINLPVKKDAFYNLYEVCQSGGTIEGDPGLDLTDSIFDVKLVKVVNRAGLAFVAHFAQGPSIEGRGREIIINGTLNNETAFGLTIDKETWNATLKSTVTEDASEDLFLMIDVVVGNHNRR